MPYCVIYSTKPESLVLEEPVEVDLSIFVAEMTKSSVV